MNSHFSKDILSDRENKYALGLILTCSVVCFVLYIQKLAHFLALLPKSRGDEESWSMMMQKILIAINDQLNFAFQGLEEGRCWLSVS